MVVTSLQLIQMVVGCLVNFWVIQMKSDGKGKEKKEHV